MSRISTSGKEPIIVVSTEQRDVPSTGWRFHGLWFPVTWATPGKHRDEITGFCGHSLSTASFRSCGVLDCPTRFSQKLFADDGMPSLSKILASLSASPARLRGVPSRNSSLRFKSSASSINHPRLWSPWGLTRSFHSCWMLKLAVGCLNSPLIVSECDHCDISRCSFS